MNEKNTGFKFKRFNIDLCRLVKKMQNLFK